VKLLRLSSPAIGSSSSKRREKRRFIAEKRCRRRKQRPVLLAEKFALALGFCTSTLAFRSWQPCMWTILMRNQARASERELGESKSAAVQRAVQLAVQLAAQRCYAGRTFQVENGTAMTLRGIANSWRCPPPGRPKLLDTRSAGAAFSRSCAGKRM
jgi:hypothetical protein